jgi:excisionase family DNA binding protein
MKSERVAYNVDEVAELLPLGRSAIYEGFRKGEIPCLKVGRRTLVPAWWIRQQLDGPATPGKAA